MNELAIHDIHLPETVSIWPLALGWWLSLLLVIGLVLGWFIWARYRKNQQRKYAIRKASIIEFNKIKKNHTEDKSMQTLHAISRLLRRTTLSYLPRKEVAGLTGKKWTRKLNSLNHQAVFSDQICQLLNDAAYQQNVSFDSNQLFTTCEHWVTNLPAKNINT